MFCLIILYLRLHCVIYIFSMQEMRCNGIMDRIQKKVWPPKYVEVLHYSLPSVTFGTVTIIYMIIIMGIMLAIFILILEFTVKALKKKKVTSSWPPV